MMRIVGPPGTGKTTTLIRYVAEALAEGINPHQIGFFSFTRRACNEAKQRASEEFGFNPDEDLPWFRTLHSLALRLSDVNKDQIMQTKHYSEFAQTAGINLGTEYLDTEESLSGLLRNNHPILSVINLARIRKSNLKTEYNNTEINYPWNIVEHVAESYEKYKVKNDMVDFTDLLSQFVPVARERLPQLKLSLLDEAQDLSLLQWDIAFSIEECSHKMFCAGDDDQAIYRWSGADVDTFIGLDGNLEVLENSYRLPRKVYEVSQRVAQRIKKRVSKSFRPMPREGEVHILYDVPYSFLKEGQWLILAQTNYMLGKIEQQLKQLGYLYSINFKRSIDEKVTLAVNSWERLRKGKRIDLRGAKAMYGLMTGNGKHIARGYKNIKVDDDEITFSLSDLQNDYGLLIGDDLIWHEALNRIPAENRAYIIALMRKGEKFNATPRISLSTIHGAKGAECDNVILLSDISTASEKEFHRNPDDLHRVFYVAVTRAKERLYLVQAEDFDKSYQF
jgi:superfamily I DNA/RNA helicase